jgi:hypothetical protein
VQYHEQPQESNLFSSQSAPEKSTDSKFKNESKEQLVGNTSSHLEQSTPYCNPLNKKDSLSLNGGTKPPVGLDVDTTSVVIWEKPSSRTLSPPKTAYCPTNHEACRRTWIANSIGKFLAYALYPPEVAEDWMAETDIRREETIAKSGFQNSFVLLLFDLIWTADMVIQKIARILPWFK